jgi:5'-3' exonuclease
VDRPLLLVDTPSLYFRAFFGIPESAAKTPDGQTVNAVRGLLDMLATLIRTRRPDRLVCAFDNDWRPAWRVSLIGTYKAHRVAPAGGEVIPDNLSPQVPIILAALAAFGIPAIGADGYEADDVLGTLATTQPGPVEVVSGDRDLFQLIDDAKPIRLLYCGKGIANLDVCDNAFVQAKYGVAATQYADFAALRGDPSDGLPGVPGVGEKTAARLISTHGSLAAVVAALDDPAAGFAPGLRAKLQAAAGYLAVAPKVVEVARDVALPDTDMTLSTSGPRDADALMRLAEAYNLAGATKRLVDAIAGVAD